jgi:hypothetical protein
MKPDEMLIKSGALMACKHCGKLFTPMLYATDYVSYEIPGYVTDEIS